LGNIKARIALILIAVAMMSCAAVVLILNQNTSTELLGSIAFLGALAVLITVLVLYARSNGYTQQEQQKKHSNES